MAQLQFVRNGKIVGTKLLRPGLTIGRSKECGIFLPDIFVSRSHCAFALTDDGWQVTDTESRNGIWVRNERVDRYLLEDNDVLEIGTIAVRFVADPRPVGRVTNAPFGYGPMVSEMIETVYAAGYRPEEFVQISFKPTAAAAVLPAPIPEPEVYRLLVPDHYDTSTPNEQAEEWAEIDMEFTIVAAAEAMPDDVDEADEVSSALSIRGVGNPKRRSMRLAAKRRQTDDDGADEPVAAELLPRDPSTGRRGARRAAMLPAPDVGEDEEAADREPVGAAVGAWASLAWSTFRTVPLKDQVVGLYKKARETDAQALVGVVIEYRKPLIGAAAALAVVLYAGTWVNHKIAVRKAIAQQAVPKTINEIVAQGN